MDPIEVGFFYRSYVRRKKFEAELIVSAIAVAMGGKTETPAAPQARKHGKPNARTPEATPDRQVVPAHQFFKILESR